MYTEYRKNVPNNTTGMYLDDIDKLDQLDWSDMEKKHKLYHRMKRDFESMFKKSYIVKQILSNSELKKLEKPTKSNGEKYKFPYTYIAVHHVVDTLKNHRDDLLKSLKKFNINSIIKNAKIIHNKTNTGVIKFMINSNRILSKHYKLIDKYHDIVNNYLRLVVNVANKFSRKHSSSFSFSDVIQEGNIGLLKTLNSYNVNNKTMFSTYGVKGIINQIKRSLTAKSWTIKLPEKVIKSGFIINKKRHYLETELGREPTMEEISDESGLELDEVKKTYDILHKYSMLVSLDKPKSFSNHGESDNGQSRFGTLTTFEDMLVDNTTNNDAVSVDLTQGAIESTVDAIISNMGIVDKDNVDIIKMKLGFLDGLKFDDSQIMDVIDENEYEYNNRLNCIKSTIKNTMEAEQCQR